MRDDLLQFVGVGFEVGAVAVTLIGYAVELGLNRAGEELDSGTTIDEEGVDVAELEVEGEAVTIIVDTTTVEVLVGPAKWGLSTTTTRSTSGLGTTLPILLFNTHRSSDAK